MLAEVSKGTRKKKNVAVVVNTLLPPGYTKMQGVTGTCTGCNSFIRSGVLGKGKFVCLQCWDAARKTLVDK